MTDAGRKSFAWSGFSCGLLFGVFAAACGSDSAAPRAGGSNEGSDFGGGVQVGSGGTATGGGVPQNPDDGMDLDGAAGTAQEPPLPPEREQNGAFQAPVTTGHFVWTANPRSGRVALIDARNLEVTVLTAGLGPTYLAALSSAADDEEAAVVLNVQSRDATLFRVSSEGDVASQTFATHAGANRLAVSPAGRVAVAWTDFREFDEPDPTDGFQDVTVVDLRSSPPTVSRVSVGYRPSAIAFDAEETRAFAVTEPGISVIELAAEETRVTDLVELTDDVLGNPAARDVTITEDGAHALVRVEGRAEVGLISLSNGERTVVPMSGPVTDLDLSEDGRRAVAVIRENSEIALLPVPEVFEPPHDFDSLVVESETFGLAALSPDGASILLYMNAVDSDRVTIVDAAPGAGYLTHRSVALHGPVENVLVAPDGRHALVEQAPAAGSVKPGAFSVVPISVERAPKIVGTDAPLHSVALMPGDPSDRALVTVRSDDPPVAAVYLVRLPSLQVDPLALASPPLASGIVAESGRGYVAQEHPEGRITFVDLADGGTSTLTGFELAVKVVE